MRNKTIQKVVVYLMLLAMIATTLIFGLSMFL
ncbi:stressosome-associated protein Prli42 [Falsibacillus albus]|nr:stressosome-associated protein Prli42 [Falsibacillus albus]